MAAPVPINGQKWSAREMEVIQQHYSTSTCQELQALLPGRSQRSLRAKAERMGLKKDPDVLIEIHRKALLNADGHGHAWCGGVRMRGPYRSLYYPDHPRADQKGYVMEHILIFEASTGISIPRGCVVHHLDKNPLNNDVSNLALMASSAHISYHNHVRWSDKKCS